MFIYNKAMFDGSWSVWKMWEGQSNNSNVLPSFFCSNKTLHAWILSNFITVVGQLIKSLPEAAAGLLGTPRPIPGLWKVHRSKVLLNTLMCIWRHYFMFFKLPTRRSRSYWKKYKLKSIKNALWHKLQDFELYMKNNIRGENKKTIRFWCCTTTLQIIIQRPNSNQTADLEKQVCCCFYVCLS